MNLKKLIEITPLIVGFLIFNGFLKLYIYYNFWNIKIIDYLDFSEILLSFLNDLNILLFCLIFFLFHQLFGAKLLEDKIDLESFKNTIENNKKKFLLFCFAVFIIFMTIFMNYNYVFWLYMSVAALFQFLIFLFEHLIDDDEQTPLVLATTLAFLTFTICISFYDIKKTKEDSQVMISTVKTSDEIIITNENLILIGKSQKFIYFFDRKNYTARIIPAEKIEDIKIRK